MLYKQKYMSAPKCKYLNGYANGCLSAIQSRHNNRKGREDFMNIEMGQESAELRGSAARGKQTIILGVFCLVLSVYLHLEGWQPGAWVSVGLGGFFVTLKSLVQILRWPLPVARIIAETF